MSRFLDLLREPRTVLMDGAMGTELRRAGLPDSRCAEAWNVTHPQTVRAVHQAYRAAGARCLLTNTFQANRPALLRHGLPDSISAEICRAGLGLARSACGSDGFVIGDIGPVITDSPSDEDLAGIEILAEADALLLETMSEPDEAARLMERCERRMRSSIPPVLISFAFQTDADSIRTRAGLPPEEVARRIARLDVAALGTNCGREISVRAMAEILVRYRSAASLPVFARPNAGTPSPQQDGWRYPHSASAMARDLPLLLASGPALLGGCCGTTPAYISAFRQELEVCAR